jgi:hypothetical protein
MAALLAATAINSRADDAYTNRLTLSARFGFNVSARFKAVRGLVAPAPPSRTTPNGDKYNYDDGYVLTDISGNFGNQTWYWGYDNSSRQTVGNSIQLSKTTVTGGSSPATADGDPSPGFEIMYNRPLGNLGPLTYGFEIAGNYMNLSLRNTQILGAKVHRVTDSYDFTPGTTPPTATSDAPYQGSYGGPGFVVGSTPSSSTSSDTTSALIVGSRQVDADVFGGRIGPNLELPLGRKFKIGASGGFACAFIDEDVSWSETIMMGGAQGNTLKGHGSASGFDVGFYLEGLATYEINDRWDIVGGVQYQYLDNFRSTIDGRGVELHFSNSLMMTIGLGFKF